MNDEQVKILRDDFLRFLQHLPWKGDTLSVLLKGHLLVEELVGAYLEQKIGAKALRDADLIFYQAICLAEALDDNPARIWLWGAVKKLNKLRRQLAHNLEPKGFSAKLDEFVDFVEIKTAKSGFPLELTKDFGKLPFAIMSIHTWLSGLVRVKRTSLLSKMVEDYKQRSSQKKENKD